VVIPISSPAEEYGTNTMLLHRTWYAAQRAGLHYNDVAGALEARQAYGAAHLQSVAESMGLSADALATMQADASVLSYAEGEVIQPVNSIPQAVGFIAEGTVGMFVYAEDGRQLPLGELTSGDFIGGTALTRQRMLTGAVALTDITIVSVPREAMNDVVQQDHRLARQIGDTIDMRRESARAALLEAAQGVR
jgi:CRP-like cAMP-binding protein